jgi:hypothetical protein
MILGNLPARAGFFFGYFLSLLPICFANDKQVPHFPYIPGPILRNGTLYPVMCKLESIEDSLVLPPVH